MSICPDNQGRLRRPSVIGLGPARAKTDFKITYPGFGAAIHALNGRARIWLDECADGIPVGDGMMVEIGYLPYLIEAARNEGFVVAEGDETD